MNLRKWAPHIRRPGGHERGTGSGEVDVATLVHRHRVVGETGVELFGDPAMALFGSLGGRGHGSAV